jgi:hypothetical protein
MPSSPASGRGEVPEGVERFVPVNDEARKAHTNIYGFAAIMVPEKIPGDGQWVRASDLPRIRQAWVRELVDGYAESEGSQLCPPILDVVAAIGAQAREAWEAEAKEELERLERQRDAAAENGCDECEDRALKAEAALAAERERVLEEAERWSKRRRKQAHDLIHSAAPDSRSENLAAANAELLLAQGVEMFFATLNPSGQEQGGEDCERCEGKGKMSLPSTGKLRFHPCPYCNGTGKKQPAPEEGERRCEVPPEGWRCTREPGHDGPCAAVEDVLEFTVNAPEILPPDQYLEVVDLVKRAHLKMQAAQHPALAVEENREPSGALSRIRAAAESDADLAELPALRDFLLRETAVVA